STEVNRADFERRTGWTLKPEGACKGDVCVPLPIDGSKANTLEAKMLSDRLGMPLIHDADAGVWALGPESLGRALTSAKAPDFTLPDYKGNQFSLSSLRGKKALIVTWASW